MNRIRALLWRIDHRLTTINLRERVLLVTTISLLLIAIRYAVFEYTALKPQLNRSAEISQIQQRVVAVEDQLVELQQKLEAYRQQDLGAQITAKQQNIAAIEALISTQTRYLITPENMSQVLRDILANQQDLQLVALSTPERQIMRSPLNESAVPTDAVYRHSVRVRLTGSYAAVANYLQVLEALPWQIYWQSLSYTSEDYPFGVLELEVFTLNSEAEWLGV